METKLTLPTLRAHNETSLEEIGTPPRQGLKLPSQDDIERAAKADFDNQKKYDNAYDRKKGFYAGVLWLFEVLKQQQA
jgi:hypothetical protein